VTRIWNKESSYSRGNNSNKKYYRTINSNSERDITGSNWSTHKLRMDIQEIKLKHQLVNIPIKDNENNVDKDTNQLPHKSCSREKTNKISENLGSKYGEIKCSLAYSKDPNSKLLTLNSGKSLFETESDVNTKAGSSYSSAYFRYLLLEYWLVGA